MMPSSALRKYAKLRRERNLNALDKTFNTNNFVPPPHPPASSPTSNFLLSRHMIPNYPEEDAGQRAIRADADELSMEVTQKLSLSGTPSSSASSPHLPTQRNRTPIFQQHENDEGDWAVYHGGESGSPGQQGLKVELQHTLNVGSIVCSVQYSTDGQLLGIGTNKKVHVFHSSSGLLVSTIDCGGAQDVDDCYIRSVCFTGDARRVVGGGEDHEVRVWEVSGGNTPTLRLQGHDSDVYSVDCGGAEAGREVILSGSGDRTVKVWDARDGTAVRTYGHSEDGVTSVQLGAGAQQFVSGSLDDSVSVCDTETGAVVERMRHDDSVYACRWGPMGRDVVVSGSLDRTARVWDVRSGQCTHTLRGHKDFVLSVAFGVQGQWVVSGSKDRSVHFWDVRGGRGGAAGATLLLGHRSSVVSIAPNTQTRVIATGSGDCRSRTWLYG